MSAETTTKLFSAVYIFSKKCSDENLSKVLQKTSRKDVTKIAKVCKDKRLCSACKPNLKCLNIALKTQKGITIPKLIWWF